MPEWTNEIASEDLPSRITSIRSVEGPCAGRAAITGAGAGCTCITGIVMPAEPPP